AGCAGDARSFAGWANRCRRSVAATRSSHDRATIWQAGRNSGGCTAAGGCATAAGDGCGAEAVHRGIGAESGGHTHGCVAVEGIVADGPRREDCFAVGAGCGAKVHALLIFARKRASADAAEDGDLIARLIDGAVAVESFGDEEGGAVARHAARGDEDGSGP